MPDPLHVYTVPVLLHVVADSAEDAVDRLYGAADNITDAGPVTLSANGRTLTVLYMNLPEGAEDYDGTQHAYDLTESEDKALYDEAFKGRLPKAVV
jgi:hypothetical protein